MLGRTMKSMRRRLGPAGLSVAAAALTAIAFAAVSVAAEDDKKSDQGEGDRAEFQHLAPPDLSAEDREALESFRQCMEDQGVEGPPSPPELGEGEDGEDGEERSFHRRLEPPSEEERAKIEKALEACEDKLPEGMPGPHFCGPGGPGPGGPEGEGREDEGREGEGVVIPAPPSGESQSSTEQAPQGSSS